MEEGGINAILKESIDVLYLWLIRRDEGEG